MDPKERKGGSKPQKQQPQSTPAEPDPRRVQAPGQVSHGERKGEAEREPEEPHGDSEAV